MESNSVSNCCGVQMYPDSPHCPKCLEHCDIEVECAECSGQGVTKFFQLFRIPCKNCNGEGYITNN